MASKDAWLLKFKEERQQLEAMSGEQAIAATTAAFGQKGIKINGANNPK